MAFVIPEVALQHVISTGIAKLRTNPEAFNDIFGTYCQEELSPNFGSAYIDKIRNWFYTTKVPVVMAWTMNPERIPCISIHLSSDAEDEGKAAMYDFWGDNEEGELQTAVITSQIDIGIHANRAADEVLWLYYIVSYILFSEKRLVEKLGMKLQTYTASDYSRTAIKSPENTWSRYLRFRVTTQNFWQGEEAITPDVEVEMDFDRKVQKSKA